MKCMANFFGHKMIQVNLIPSAFCKLLGAELFFSIDNIMYVRG